MPKKIEFPSKTNQIRPPSTRKPLGSKTKLRQQGRPPLRPTGRKGGRPPLFPGRTGGR